MRSILGRKKAISYVQVSPGSSSGSKAKITHNHIPSSSSTLSFSTQRVGMSKPRSWIAFSVRGQTVCFPPTTNSIFSSIRRLKFDGQTSRCTSTTNVKNHFYFIYTTKRRHGLTCDATQVSELKTTSNVM